MTVDLEQLRPPMGDVSEVIWLRGFEAGVNQMREDRKTSDHIALREAADKLADVMNITTLIAHALDDGVIRCTSYCEHFQTALDAMNAALAAYKEATE